MLQELLTRHKSTVAEFLSKNYDWVNIFFFFWVTNWVNIFTFGCMFLFMHTLTWEEAIWCMINWKNPLRILKCVCVFIAKNFCNTIQAMILWYYNLLLPSFVALKIHSISCQEPCSSISTFWLFFNGDIKGLNPSNPNYRCMKKKKKSYLGGEKNNNKTYDLVHPLGYLLLALILLLICLVRSYKRLYLVYKTPTSARFGRIHGRQPPPQFIGEANSWTWTLTYSFW